MKKSLLLFLILITSTVSAQLNITLLNRLDTIHAGTGVWGYVDELGNEYAISTGPSGFTVVDITNATSPVIKLSMSLTGTINREVQVYQDHAYIVSESYDGLVSVDLGPLPGTLSPANVHFSHGTDSTIWNVHSLFIDEFGKIYLNGGHGYGTSIRDLVADPLDPPLLGNVATWYVHDSYARGDTLYCANIIEGTFSVWDVSNLPATLLLSYEETPKHGTHNCWLSANGDYLFTTDEVDSSWLVAYNISDLGNIQEVDRIRNSDTSGSLPHNTYWMNNYLITAYYTDGVTIHDVSDPANMVLVGQFDTSPLSGTGFFGAWGAYPYLPSGKLLVSDRAEGLFILQPTYTRAAFLKGTVTDAVTGNPIKNASIRLLSFTDETRSDIGGNYQMNTLATGTQWVVFNALGHVSDTLAANLSAGNTVVLDAALQPISNIHLTGTVKTMLGRPIEKAQVLIRNEAYTYPTYTDANGVFEFPAFYLDPSYPQVEIAAGKWGYVSYCDSAVNIFDLSQPLDIRLQNGYYDDFIFDHQWQVFSTATAGAWERAQPYRNPDWITPFAMGPDADAPGDCMDQAFVTGNDHTTHPFLADVDNGYTRLTSPVFDLSGYTDPQLSFDLFAKLSHVQDSISVVLYDGSPHILVTLRADTGLIDLDWEPFSFRIADYSDQSSFVLKVFALGNGTGTFTEAGFDHFVVTGAPAEEPLPTVLLPGIYPNPTQGSVRLVSVSKISTVQVVDMTGKMVMQLNTDQTTADLDLSHLARGVYNIKMVDEHQQVSTARIVKQ